MPSILDVFSGCGGLSLGAHQAGFETKLAIDCDPILSSSFSLNFPKATLLNADIRDVNAANLRQFLAGQIYRYDGVVGGPPCQAFSAIGRRDVNDPRRTLVLEFFRLVKLIKPKFFVFENVRGLAFEQNVGLLNSGLEMLPSHWKIMGPHVLNAADFGAPTRRKRIFVVGFDRNQVALPEEAALFRKPQLAATVRDAIGDLVSAVPLSEDQRGFDFWRYDGRRSISDYAMRLRTKSGKFSGHRQTNHTAKTLKRFAGLKQGQVDVIGKYYRLSWDGLCPTLRAGTGSDRGSYQAVRPIHPEENRVITPREAARLQGFPDSFLFHPTVWHSCRMIGNSVSPIIARVLLKRIAKAVASDFAGDALQAA